MIKTIQSRKRDKIFWEELPNRNYDTIYDDGSEAVIVVDASRTYQTHMGFGGAFTEAAATVLETTSHREQALDAYFSKEGLQYNLGRTVIHSCDFSVGSRTYIDEGDTSLSSFDMSEDDAIIVPFIKDAKARAGKLWLLASPWSPPAFMKTNNHLYFGGSLKPEFYNVWAHYIVKYLEGMKQRNLEITAISIQNEPEAVQTWESCHYSIEQERLMVDVLHERLKEAGLDVNIIIWDHNRDRVVERAHGILKDTKDKVWGIGHHWYVCETSENLSVVHDLYPDKHILFTEGCVEFSNPELNSGNHEEDLWQHGEHYGRNIIKDSLHYTEGFIDWNLFLDEMGGPNHVHNYCEAPIMIDTKSGALMVNPSYYYIGHFSRHIKPMAKRVHLSVSHIENVYATAYKNPNGDIVVVVQNEGWIRNITLIVNGQHLNLSLPDHSITTLVVIK